MNGQRLLKNLALAIALPLAACERGALPRGSTAAESTSSTPAATAAPLQSSSLEEAKRMLAAAERAGGQPPLPINDEMQAWAAQYRLQFAPVGAAVQIIDTGTPTRETCNALLTATYSARGHLQTAPDPDVDQSVRRAIGALEEAGKACLRSEDGPRDLYLTLAGAGLLLAKRLAEERYGASLQVDELSAIVHEGGSSNINKRALAAAANLKGSGR